MTFLFPKEPELHSSWKVLRMIILVNNIGIPSDSGLATYHCFTSQQLPEVSKGPHGDQAHRWWR